MGNIQKDILFDHFIQGIEKEMQATLRRVMPCSLHQEKKDFNWMLQQSD